MDHVDTHAEVLAAAEAQRARITVDITPETARALRLACKLDDVTLTEALRRLVGYGDLVYRTIRVGGGEVLVRHGDKQDVVRLLDEPGARPASGHDKGGPSRALPAQ